MFQRYIGDKAFYRRVLGVAVPIIIQNGITNFVSLLDNIMVGQVGTIPMSGVSIVNQLLFVFNLCVFGASSGAGIFTAQFRGSNDQEGIRHTFRFKFLICITITLIGIAIFLAGGSGLIGSYLTGDGDTAMAEGALEYGLKYLHVMIWGFLPFALANTYSSTLRETGETFVPMVGGIIADASETVLVGAGLLKNTIGVFGMLGILASCAYPFFQLGVQYLLYKLTAFLSAAVGAPLLCKLINGLGGAFGLVLGMTGACALLLFVSVLSSVAAVMP